MLTAWFFFAIVHLVFYYWYATGLYLQLPLGLIGWDMPLALVHGPFLYRYIRSLTVPQYSGRRNIWHFVPFAAAYLVLLPVLLLPGREKLGGPRLQSFLPLLHGVTAAIVASGIVYIALSLVLLRRHKRNIAGEFSNTDKITLNWLRYLIAGMGVIWFFVIFFRTEDTIYISVSLFIFFIGYFGIRQVGIFSNAPAVPSGYGGRMAVAGYGEGGENAGTLAEAERSPEPGTAATAPAESGARVKYERSGLTEAEAGALHAALTTVMREKQPYREPELTLGQLAAALDVHPAMLSQVINSCEQKSFYDYVNAWRVEAFVTLAGLPESRQFTLLSLAYDCGFNSKSSFNRNFRKVMHCSPTDYIKKRDVPTA